MVRKKTKQLILWYKDINKKDIALVGGKNASLGEMLSKLTKKGIHPVKSRKAGALLNSAESNLTGQFNGVNIPDGFALTTKAYWYFLKANKIDERLREIFSSYARQRKTSFGGKFNIKILQETGKAARNLILKSEFPEDLKREIIKAYKKLSQKYGQKNVDPVRDYDSREKLQRKRISNGVDVAVRSSGVAEDAPTMSFAGQFESFLNVSGEKNLFAAIKKCLASTFNDRVIAYREEKGLSHLKFALSVGVQKMVRSDLASSGVMFTLDTETGFSNVVLINSILGVGEMLVKGKITPDEFYVFKPTFKEGFKPIIIKNLGRKNKKYVFSRTGGLKEVSISQKGQLRFALSDEEVLTLAHWACQIEEHYKMPQDIEWAKDGKRGELFITQARPETIYTPRKTNFYEEYKIKATKKPILTGIAIGNKIGQGKVHAISDVSRIGEFQKGEVLVTKMTDPDWVPALRIASAIVTDEGSKVCHAAIVSRELGIPAIVGTREATKILKSGQEITIDCTQGLDGRIYLGKVPFQIKRYDLKKIPKLKTKIMINIGAPDIAFKTSFLPNDGVGLARIEFILAEKIRIHPLALYYYRELKIPNPKSQILNKFQIPKFKIQKIIKQIDEITLGYKDKKQYFINELAEGIAQIASAFWPKPVIVRLSDLKTNEYRALIGGELFEPEESNPMLGWRGASRYYDEKFKPAFEIECQAIKKAREVFGLKNIWVMVPFCRTVEEGKKVLDLMAKNGLKKGENGLKVIVMCEIPSNVILAEEFLEIFDGMSIGSNDLLQCSLGIDRDNANLQKIADERDPTIKKMVSRVIRLCNLKKKYCGICGQAPSDYLEFAEFLIKEGIESISLNPDTIIKTILDLSKPREQKRKQK